MDRNFLSLLSRGRFTAGISTCRIGDGQPDPDSIYAALTGAAGSGSANGTLLVHSQVHSLRVVIYSSEMLTQTGKGWTGRLGVAEGRWIHLPDSPEDRYTLSVSFRTMPVLNQDELGALARSMDADGVVTDLEQVVPGVLVADCHPLYIWGELPGREVRGILHSGWQGCGISMVAGRAMNRYWGIPFSDISVYSGPGICSRCYPVTEDRAAVFVSRFGAGAVGRAQGTGEFSGRLMPSIDIQEANRLATLDMGMQWLGGTGLCTAEQEELWSHRCRERRGAGRMLAFWLPTAELYESWRS